MDAKQFHDISVSFLADAQQRLEGKGKEYNLSSDRYDQLIKQADLNGITVEEVISVLMTKHIVMLCNNNHEMTYGEFKERALDVIAYLCLINGCYKEAENL